MRIKKLIVIAGPSGVGKSFHISRLRQGFFPQFTKQLEMGEPNLWTYLLAKDLENNCKPETDRLILHYDLTRPWKYKLRSGFFEDPPLKIISTSEEIAVVTLWAPPEILISRFLTRQKMKKPKNKLKKNVHLLHRLFLLNRRRNKKKPKNVLQLYKNHSAVLTLYDEWIKFCKVVSLNAHCILNTIDDPPTLMPLEKYFIDTRFSATEPDTLLQTYQN